jgi:hypothetical protein
MESLLPNLTRASRHGTNRQSGGLQVQANRKA